MVVCKKCKAENKQTRYFCTSCGAFLKDDEIEEKAYNLPQMKIMRIVDNLRHMDFGEPVPDEAFEYQARTIERLSALYSLPEFPQNSQLTEKMRNFLSICRHPEFQIAFVGTIKTGKSTLINALLGKNYASMAVTPETAALTKFRASPKDYVHVTFYTEEEWEQLWASRSNAEKYMEEYNRLNAESCKDKWVGHPPLIEQSLTSEEVEGELAKWSSSKSPEHYFVKEIDVGISTLPPEFPPQVVLVDTPGLFDPVAYRSQLTKEYIRRANAVFVCVEAKKLPDPETKVISDVLALSSRNKEKVYIIATHLDVLNDPDEDWKKNKESYVNTLQGKGFFPDEETARANIIATAALIHNLCRDYGHLDDADLKPLKKYAVNYGCDVNSADDRKNMMEKANIATVEKIIKTKLAGNYKNLLLKDIKDQFDTIRHDLQRIAVDMKEDHEELLEASQASLQELQKKIAEKDKIYKRIESDSTQLKGMLDQLEATTASHMDSICANLRLKLNPGYTKVRTDKEKRSRFRKIADAVLGRGKGNRR